MAVTGTPILYVLPKLYVVKWDMDAKVWVAAADQPGAVRVSVHINKMK
jgi:hypothetical protein